MKSYDLAIIGSGPGGYIAALYASRHGLKVAVIEKGLTGGTCLNQGCIPTKSLLNSVSLIQKFKTAANYGININGYTIDFKKMMLRKDELVSRLRTGVETLLRANKVDLIKGTASFIEADIISVNGIETINAKKIIIASGSKSAELQSVPVDDIDILSSTSILNIDKIPQSLLIVGGGVIGCEFACLFNRLGTKVTIVEVAERLIPGISREASKKLETIFRKNGVDVLTAAKVESFKKSVSLTVNISGGKVAEFEKILVAVGRIPDIASLGLDRAGVKVYNGEIRVDHHLKTDNKNIYAIGDCINGPKLAHKASYDGMLVIDDILGISRKADYSNIPNCIWTEPEIATVGISEESAKALYNDVKVAKFPYLASGKAYLEGEVEGFVKIIGRTDGEILGVEIFGKDACNLIGEATLAKENKINIKDWARVVHGHPTLSEILQEACHVFNGTPIHSV